MKKAQKKKRAAALISACLLCILSALTVFGSVGASAIMTDAGANTEEGWGPVIRPGQSYQDGNHKTDSTSSKASISKLVETIFSSFSTVIKSLAGGIKDAFGSLIYIDPSASSPVFSPLVLFLFTMAGVGLAAGILYKMFGLIKSHRQG